MGIPTVIRGVLKGVAWGKVAGLVMEYGPELYRQACERFRRDGVTPELTEAEAELHERIDRLEKLLVEQEGVIRAQVTRNEQLEEACLRLEGRVNRMRIVSAVLAGVSLLLAVLLFRNG